MMEVHVHAGWLAVPVLLLVLAAGVALRSRHAARWLAARSHSALAATDRLRAALEANGQGTYDAWLPTGECVVSPAYARILGYDPHEFREDLQSWRERLHPDDVDETLRLLAECLEGRVKEFSLEFRQRTRDGEWKHVLSQGAIVERAPDGTPLRLVGTWTDMTERERAEAQLREREARYRAQRHALVRLTSDEAAAGEGLDSALSLITRVAAETLGVARVSVWIYDEGGDALECRALNHAGVAAPTAGMRLQRSTYPAYFDALSHSTVIAASDAHRDPRTREFSDSYLTPLGITSMLDARIHTGGVVGVLCHEQVGPPRKWTEDEETFAVAVASIVALALEGAQRRRSEEQLRRQRDLLHRAHQALNSHLHNSPLAVIEWDREQRVTHWSARAQDIFGWSEEEVVNRRADEWRFVHEEDLASVQQMMTELAAGRRNSQSINRNHRKDGAVLHCEWYSTALVDEAGQVVSLFSLVHDVTERVRAEAEQRTIQARLLQSQKLETVGRLAGGIAHDFNNLLTVINGTADVALETQPLVPAVRDDLRQIREAGERAARLTSQLLAFSRKQILQSSVIDVNRLIGNLHGMMRRLIGEHLELVLQLGEEAGRVEADAGQLEQVVLNLVVNARDAMPDGGTVTIRTGRLDLDAGDPRLPAGARPGSHAHVSVSDTGVGMDEATRLQAFEPFYTTKDPEKGTGLGLAMVHGIVLQTGGAIWVESEPGRGSTFSVCLPHSTAPAQTEPLPASPPRAPGRGTILVVEDEPALRSLAVRILRGSGYHVLSAGDGDEALGVLRASPHPVHLLLTDVVMPGMNGRELADRVLAEHPGIKVLFTSGYTDDEIIRHGVLDRAREFIPKPYTIDTLTARVRSILDAGSTTAVAPTP